MAMRYFAPYPGGGGDPYRPRGPHALRIGDAERDAAAADLGEHYAAGRLTLDELNERLESVFAARTYGQLARIMADLPGPGRLGRFAEPQPPVSGYGWTATGGTHGIVGANRHWGAGVPPTTGYRPRDLREQRPTDRAGRFAALSLLMLVMLVWLFTALLFARQGYYHPTGPWGPGGSGGGFGAPAQPYGQSGEFGFGK